MTLLMDAMDQYDELMASEDEQLAALQDSYKAFEILHEEQNQQCQTNFTSMHKSCNTCIMEKCQDYYRNNCASLEPDPMEIIEPPCKTRPDSPCEEPERTDQSIGSNIDRFPPRPTPVQPSSGMNIQISVNGESVPSMTQALEMIRTTMTQKVTEPEADCEPGNSFAEFKEVVSPVSRSSSYQVSMSSSGGNGNTGAAMGSLGSLDDMMQNENAKEQMSRFENLWNQRAGAFGQDRSDSSGASRFSYSMSGSSGSGPRTSSSSFRMTSSSGGSFPQAQSLGSSMTGGCSECGGCGQQQQGSSAFRQNPVANSGPCGFQERAEVGHGRDLFGEVRRDLVSLENSGNGKITENGNTFSYSWEGTGGIPENLEEIMNLGLSRLNRQRAHMRSGCNTGRCTRNLREGLARSRRYYPTKTRRAVSQCAIEQAAKEAAERARQEEARRLSELAKQGGYNSACSMLNSQHGEAQTNMMVTQLLTNLKGELSRATEKCMSSGNCHNTRVNINIVGRTSGGGCNPDDSNSPCNQAQSLYDQTRNKINEWTNTQTNTRIDFSFNGSGQPQPQPTQSPTRRPYYPETDAPYVAPQRTTPGRNAPVQPNTDSSSVPVDNFPSRPNPDDYSYDGSQSYDDSTVDSDYYSSLEENMNQLVENPAEWAIWGSWSSCDINCANGNEKGTQVRRRNCEIDRQVVSNLPVENCNIGDDVQYRECLPVPKPCNTVSFL
ncbi:Oidioi.mRNA.OKI2018_I69.XSR.g15119.t2.cds [Oikopleura dioica]|uniref:Oidioi.mRNA.OKI2018_I69.XSR.g15119.t2.cds n=1 Tax=Oikopleura dioica TaxID=34765 RepID=A0ABN7SGW6_OIKDI|nr:Oidioi.mRNA.OKI2018_I69.XSR.g15119.t2.cds [Oikopleura dioica]